MSVGMISDKSASSRGLPRQDSEYVWKRNSLWAALPTVTESDQKFVGLYAVYPDAAFIALHATTSSGTYTVDWGDGTNEAVSSGTVAYHTYDYTDADLLSTSLPYKQAIVTVTPTTANLLTVDINRKHSTSGLQAYDAGWLDIVISLPNASTGKPFVISAGTRNVGLRELEICTIKTLGAHTDMSYMFDGCSSLQSVPAFNTAAVTNMSYMFYNCYSLQSVPAFNTAAVTNMSNMFYGCSSLQSVPAFNTAAVTNMVSMFYGCYSLQSVPAFNTAAVTTTSYMFYNCYSLKSVPAFNTAAVTNMSSMFYYCYSLQSVPAFNTAAVTNMSYMFSSCSSLSNIDMSPIKTTLSLTNCKLSGDRLNEIYGNLGTGLTGKVITVTGNYGVSADDPTLVPSGWTVTG